MNLPDARVYVEAPGRLHFGVLDLRGSLGRWFGGIGTGAPEASLLVSAAAIDRPGIECEGADAERAREFAARFLACHGLSNGVHVIVHRALPPHAGLGSGTQLGLAVACALAKVFGIEADVTQLARAVGRTQRSGVGLWAFAGGGLILEGGRRLESEAPPPLLARIAFPAAWRCLVVIPEGASGISGTAEEMAFQSIPSPPAGDEHRVAHLALMSMLPALIEADLETFGSALRQIQEITGGWFATAQGGTFAAGPTASVIAQLSNWGAVGVGQSSWGPAAYGVLESEEALQRTLARVRAEYGPRTMVFHGPFRTEGARVWRD